MLQYGSTSAGEFRRLFQILLPLTFFVLASAEIHRAKYANVKLNRQIHAVTDEEDDIHDIESINNSTKYSSETWVYSLLCSGLIGLCGIFPLIIIPLNAGISLKSEANAARLKLLLSFAVGGLLGDVFLHLLPEAWAHVKPESSSEGHLTIGIWVLVGIVSFLAVEKVFPDDESDDELVDVSDNGKDRLSNSLSNGNLCNGDKDQTVSGEGHCEVTKMTCNGKVKNRKKQVQSKCKEPPQENGKNRSVITRSEAMSKQVVLPSVQTRGCNKIVATENRQRIKASGWLNLMANVIDNFTHGLAVAGSFSIGTKSGLITTFAIFLHEVPHEVGDFAILLNSGFNRWQAAKAQLLTASGSMLGATTVLLAESAQAAGDNTAWILPFNSGGFIYIALVTIVPNLNKEKNIWESVKQIIAIVSGITTMALVKLLCD